VQQQQAPSVFVTRIVWIVLVVSQCIYLVVPAPPTASAQGPQPMFAPILGAIAVAQALGVVVYFRRAGIARVQRGDLDPSTPEGMGQLYVVLMMSWVLTESVAIYGLVLRFLAAPWLVSGAFALGAFALMAVTNPFQSGLKPPVSAARRGEDPTPIV
jgi:hypothetical protein